MVAQSTSPKPLVGVSACLLGERVRYDGGDKRDAVVADMLAKWFDFHAVCPEAEAGLGVPRAPVRLVMDKGMLRAKGVDDVTLDVTDRLGRFSRDAIAHLNVSGFILKSKSPSCGRVGVKIYDRRGKVIKRGAGLFVCALREQWPLMPLEDELRLQDARVREHFIVRVRFYAAWQSLLSGGMTPESLSAFHAQQRSRMRMYSKRAVRLLDRLVAETTLDTLQSSSHTYLETSMAALRQCRR